MSLSFPPAPTNGQQYQNWTWNSSVGAWVPNYAAGFVTSFNGRAGPVTLQGSDNTVGQRVLLNQTIISTSTPVSSITFFYDFGNKLYEQIQIDAYNMNASVAGSSLYWRASTDGSTFDSTVSYINNVIYANNAGTGGFSSTQQAQSFAAGVVTNALNACTYSKTIISSLPANDRGKPYFSESIGWYDGYGIYSYVYAGHYGANGTIKGFQLFLPAGQITRGVFQFLGIVRGPQAMT